MTHSPIVMTHSKVSFIYLENKWDDVPVCYQIPMLYVVTEKDLKVLLTFSQTSGSVIQDLGTEGHHSKCRGTQKTYGKCTCTAVKRGELSPYSSPGSAYGVILFCCNLIGQFLYTFLDLHKEWRIKLPFTESASGFNLLVILQPYEIDSSSHVRGVILLFLSVLITSLLTSFMPI